MLCCILGCTKRKKDGILPKSSESRVRKLHRGKQKSFSVLLPWRERGRRPPAPGPPQQAWPDVRLGLAGTPQASLHLAGGKKSKRLALDAPSSTTTTKLSIWSHVSLQATPRRPAYTHGKPPVPWHSRREAGRRRAVSPLPRARSRPLPPPSPSVAASRLRGCPAFRRPRRAFVEKLAACSSFGGHLSAYRGGKINVALRAQHCACPCWQVLCRSFS